MHDIEKYGGVRLESSRMVVKVQFPNKVQMNAWLKLMRENYNSDEFSPYVNTTEFIVVY